MAAICMRPSNHSCPSFTFVPARRVTLKYVLLGLFFSMMISSVWSQKFPAGVISDSLKENANVVIRLNELSWEIKSPGEAIRRMHEVYTILNEKGDDYAVDQIRYNQKSIILNSASGYLYDASGKEINHFKKKDMEDHPYEDGSFVNDDRYKQGSFSYSRYPYTVEFEEEEELHGFMGCFSWKPQHSIFTSVESSSFSLTTPLGYDYKYRMVNCKMDPVSEEKKDKKTFSWQFRNLPALEEMPFSTDFIWYSPRLLISLGEIDLEGFKGNMTSWDEFAKFYGSLQKGRDILPEETKQKVHDLVNGISDPYVKVSILYNYLQQNTHYVDVTLGIGGWQTSEATYVATKKYGDCKALTNFMISILKEAGIKGHAVVIRGGEENGDFITDFTNDPFNHVICCVPLNKDTVWLECTDQFLPPGYLSEFTANRYGLFIDDQGGMLVHTPAYILPDNIRVRNIAAVLDNDGNLKLESNTSYKALCQDGIEKMIHHKSKDEQLEILKSKFNLPTYDVTSFSYKEDYTKRLPVISESMKLDVKDFAQVTGKRIFFKPNILSKSVERYAEDKNRKLGIRMTEEYCLVDSVQISIPPGYEMESKSMDLELSTKFGKYMNRMSMIGDKIMYYRVMKQFSGRFPAKDYTDLVKFYNDIYDADHASIVLVKKN